MQPSRFKLSRLVPLVCAFFVLQFTAPPAQALIIIKNRDGNVVPGAASSTLAELTNALASIQIDNTIFENWRNYASTTTRGALAADPALITVVAAGEGTCDPGPGFQLVSAQFMISGIAQSQHTVFSYDARAVNGQPAIGDVALGLATFAVDIAGTIDATETVVNQDQTVLGTVAVHVTSFGVTPTNGTDRLDLPAPQSVVTVTKDVLLANGGPEDQGSASLGDFRQNVSQACGASIRVTKQVACLACMPGIGCGSLPPEAYGDSATGYRTDTTSPLFCYAITITNAGTEALENITVVDSSGLDLNGCFPSESTNSLVTSTKHRGTTSSKQLQRVSGFTLSVGSSTNCFVAVSVAVDTTNTVTVGADGAISLAHVTASASAVATVLPAAIQCPADVTVQCAADVPAPQTVTATLSCAEPVIATAGDQIVPGSCPNRFSILRTFTAQDACRNRVSCVQTVTVNDTLPPTLLGVPDALTVQCRSDAPAAATVTATDNCDGPITPVLAETEKNPGSSCHNVITRTWTATDSCGNGAMASQQITVNDTTAPTISQCAPNLTVCASSGVPPPDTSLVVATDNCGGTVAVTVMPDVVNGTCPQAITRTYVASDTCGNQATCNQTITVNCAPACEFVAPNPLPVCRSTGNTLSGPAGRAAYSWSDAGSSAGWMITAGADMQTIAYTAGASGVGVFTLTVTDAGGCSSTCRVSFACNGGPPMGIGCRVTGGSGKQAGISQQSCIPGPLPKFTSHAGQVGAPFGVATPFTDASTCIRGEWQHDRHLGEGLVGSFHAAGNGTIHQFDSLMCACLPCAENPNSGGVVGGLCNPGDRICGPTPPSAPANKICFSGVGDYTFTKGQKTVKAVFRVDIEDHGEPGGKSGPAPNDRYRIRLWILGALCGKEFEPDSDRGLALRQAVACSNPLTENVSSSAGSPDIDDGGDMDQGNHQIHPLTGASCP